MRMWNRACIGQKMCDCKTVQTGGDAAHDEAWLRTKVASTLPSVPHNDAGVVAGTSDDHSLVSTAETGVHDNWVLETNLKKRVQLILGAEVEEAMLLHEKNCMEEPLTLVCCGHHEVEHANMKAKERDLVHDAGRDWTTADDGVGKLAAGRDGASNLRSPLAKLQAQASSETIRGPNERAIRFLPRVILSLCFLIQATVESCCTAMVQSDPLAHAPKKSARSCGASYVCLQRV